MRHESGNLQRRSRPLALLASVVITCCWLAAIGAAQNPAPVSAPSLTCEQMEEFLKTANVGTRRELSVGITLPSRATLDDGRMHHDASIQAVDVSKPTFQTTRGTEINFRDSWKFNVAGYELAKLLQLNMVPPYVERKVAGQFASLSWWVDDAMMERDRYKRNIQPPDPESWNDQMYAVRVFHQLIYDTDPNLTNILITKDWRIWMIDFSRAFRLMKRLQNPKDLVKCDRKLLAHLRELTPEIVQQKLGKWLTKPEIEGVLARRDLIVRFFDDEVKKKKGEAAVLYDIARTSEPCGTGLQ